MPRPTEPPSGPRAAERSRRHLGLGPRAGAAGAVYADVLDALGELDVAQEELRVADAALREQEATLAELVSAQQSEQRWRDRLAALLPVSTLDTDLAGLVVRADPRLAHTLGRTAAGLAGRPLATHLPVEQRASWRTALSRLGAGAAEERLVLTLQRRGGEPVDVEAVGLAETVADEPRVRWVLVPASFAGLVAVTPSSTRPAAVGAGPAVDQPPATGPGELGDDLAVASAVTRLILLPLGPVDQQELLGECARAVVAAVLGATTASVTLGAPTEPERLAADSAVAQQVDGLQLQLGQGPCATAHELSTTVVCDDLVTDPRWPRLAARVAATGMRAALALPLLSGRDRLGVVNVYSDRPGAFDAHAVRVGELLATSVTAVLQDVQEKVSLRRLTGDLESALGSRAVIEQAKGIIMAHHGGTPDDAFARLVKLSNQHNVKLRDLAGLLVEGGAQAGLRPWSSG